VGIVGFLQKPFGPQELIASVRDALGEADTEADTHG
jgi:FixJ family two-component response regulator